MRKQKVLAFFSLSLLFVFSTCRSPGGGINFFTIEQDIEFGKQVKAEIESNPTEYPILSETDYAQVYSYIRTMTNKLLDSPEINYKGIFEYEVKIIKRDDVLNAFCTPGGYIYVYTGLIKYLDNGDQLAGVMGHEIAHADLRHSTDELTRQHGYQKLLDIILGKNPSALKQIASGMITLQYTKKNESQADEYSVKYLSSTNYNCAGAAGFFEKLIQENGGSCGFDKYFSTHPCAADRVQKINSRAENSGCKKNAADVETYASIKALL